jgi:glycerophosphoryl diester phosphodiesterase
VNENLRTIFLDAWHLSNSRRTALVAYSVAFKALNVILLAPATALILRLFLLRWGRASVGNFEIASFLLSPVGLLSIVTVGGVLLATLYLEIAGLMRLMAEPRLKWWASWTDTPQLLRSLVSLGMVQLCYLLLISAPALLAIGGVYRLWWHGRDLNSLIVLRPPEFWWGVGVAGTIAVGLACVLIVVLLAWMLAVPTVLFERSHSPLQALAASRRTTRIQPALIAQTIAVWAVAQLALNTAMLGLAHWASLKILSIPYASLPMAALATGAVLAGGWLLTGLTSIISNISFAASVLALYRHIAKREAGSSPAAVDWLTVDRSLAAVASRAREAETLVNEADLRHARLSMSWIISGALVSLLAAALWLSAWLSQTLTVREPVEITAHRAGATHAPENTVAAIRRAIADRADWAEIDVQFTADKQIVVTHDHDLARSGGGPVSVASLTLEQIQQLDVGSLYGPEFAGERIPTFDEVLAAAAGSIRLNVELKPQGVADALELAERVVQALRAARQIETSRVCSQSLEGIQRVKELEPGVEIGYIVATSLGDVTQTPVDFLMLSHQQSQPKLVRRAHARGQQVHAWTVNDPALVPALLDAGVDNLITDSPAEIARAVQEVEALNPLERILIRARHSLLY